MNTHKVLLVLVALLLVQGVAGAQERARSAHEGPILLRNITMIDGLGHDPVPMRDILIRNGRIDRIAITTMIGEVPDDTKVIDGTGLTVLPGLHDMHTHIVAGIDYSRSNVDATTLGEVEGLQQYMLGFGYGQGGGIEGKQRYLDAHLYAGVTTILELGGNLEESTLLRDEIAAGDRSGPTIHTAGPIIEALKTTQSSVLQLTSPETRAEIKELLDAREEKGIEVVKFYTGVTPWEARHMMTEAKKRGMRGVADFWCTNQSRTVFEVSLVDAYGHGGCRQLTREEARWMAENDRFGLFTLTIFDAMSGERGYEDYHKRGLFDIPLVVDVWGEQVVEGYYDSFQSLRQQWHEGGQSMYDVQLWGNKQSHLSSHMKSIKLLYEEGAVVMLGTDAPWPPGVWPGEGLHFELELHVKAGVPPVQAIKMATYNGAVFLRREHEVGSVEAGKIADLLIVEGNPAENISDTRNIAHVIKGGKLVNREALKHR